LSDNILKPNIANAGSTKSAISETIKDNQKYHKKNDFDTFLKDSDTQPVQSENKKIASKSNREAKPHQKEAPKKTKQPDDHSKDDAANQDAQSIEEAVTEKLNIVDVEELDILETPNADAEEILEEVVDSFSNIINPIADINKETAELEINLHNDFEITEDLENAEAIISEDIEAADPLIAGASISEKQGNSDTSIKQSALNINSLDITDLAQIDNTSLTPQAEFNIQAMNSQQATQNIIQIQKVNTTDIVAQLPIGNELTLNIVKDTSNQNKISINLEPAGMGEVELVIENNRDNAVIAVLRSDKPEILDQLRKETASLEQYLAEAGLDLGGNGLGFEQKSSDDNSQNSEDQTHLSANIAETSIYNAHPDSHLSSQEKIYAHLDTLSSNTGLDIRL